MSVVDEWDRICRAEGRASGATYIQKIAAAGNPEAMFVLANWHLWGISVPRDVAACLRLLATAGAGGWLAADLLRATLVNHGAGTFPEDPDMALALLRSRAAQSLAAAAQLSLLDQSEPGRTCAVEVLSDDPSIRLVRAMLSDAECAYVIARARPLLAPSMVIDPQTGRGRPDPVRTSQGMQFGPTVEDLVIHAINRRIADVTDTDISCGELLHVLHYTRGQEFRPHVDTLPGVPNQRHVTAITYLNDAYEGGATRFNDLGLDVRPQRGDCLVFTNTLPDGRPDLRLRHAGLPIVAGEKWIATRWIRQNPYDPFRP